MHIYIVNNLISCHNLETWSKLKCLPSEHTSKLSKNENFDFDYHKFENEFYKNIFKYRELNSEKYIEIYYDAYFSSWKNELNQSEKEILIFQGPNDYRSAEYVLKENFDIKIIYINRDDYSRIVSNSFRVKKINKNKTITDIILSDMGHNYSKNRRLLLDKKINELMLRFKNKIFNTSFNKITFETKTEIKKIADWLDVKYNDLMCKPSLGGRLVDQNYVGRSIDLENFNQNNKELRILLSFYCNKIGIVTFLASLNFNLLKLLHII